jgi:hypothetical protein
MGVTRYTAEASIYTTVGHHAMAWGFEKGNDSVRPAPCFPGYLNLCRSNCLAEEVQCLNSCGSDFLGRAACRWSSVLPDSAPSVLLLRGSFCIVGGIATMPATVQVNGA